MPKGQKKRIRAGEGRLWAFVVMICASFVGVARAEVRFPLLTALNRESSDVVTPGTTLSLKYTLQPGTAAFQSIAFAFREKNGGEPLLLSSTSNNGALTASVDSNWANGTYILDLIYVRDEWNRSTSYRADGSIGAGTSSSTRENYYAGPTTHAFDFARLGFTLAGARTSYLARITDVAPVTGSPASPGQSVRIHTEGVAGAVPLTSMTLSFRHASLANVFYNLTIDTTNPTNDINFVIPQAMANGRYQLTTLSMLDRDGRQYAYQAGGLGAGSGVLSVGGISFNIPGFFGALPEFTVSGASSSVAFPQVASWNREGTGDVTAGATLRFSFTTTAGSFPARSVSFRINGPYGGTRSFVSDGASGTVSIPVAADWITGPYTISDIVVLDSVGNRGGLGSPSVSPEALKFNVRALDIGPYFTMQPAATTPTKVGGFVTLFARGVGFGTASYQWYQGEPGDTSRPIAGNFAFPTQISFAVTGNTTYWVRLLVDGITVDSNAARVVIVPPPEISLQPITQVGRVGDIVTYTIAATGTGPITYDWSGGGVSGDPMRNQPTFQFKITDPYYAGSVFCDVTGPGGTTRSVPATLTILTSPTPLHFTRVPGDAVLATGSTIAVIFQAEYAGNPPLQARWEKDGEALPADTSVSTNQLAPPSSSPGSSYAGSSSLSFFRGAAIAGKYRVVVTNGFETIYSPEAELRFVQAPVIITQPAASSTVYENVYVAVEAVGAAPLTYQWRRDGVPIPGRTENTLSNFFTPGPASARFDVVVSNPFGSVTSNPSDVTILPVLASAVINRAPASQTVNAGATVTLSGDFSGENLRYVWKHNGSIIQSGTSANLTLANVGTSDAGGYSLEASNNPFRSTVTDCTLTVNTTRAAPVILRPPRSAVYERGAVPTLDVGADGKPPLRFQWRYRGVPISPTETAQFGSDPAHLYIRNFDSTHVGAYDVVVTNDSGSVTSPIAQLDLPPPGTEGRLMNLSVRAGAGGTAGPLIVGFVIGGGTPENVPLLIRGAGAALAAFGVTNALANPTMTLYAGTSARYANDDWHNFSAVATVANRVGAFPYPATAIRDSALIPELAPGGYTVQITGSDGSSGTTLAEIYDATPAAEINLKRPRLLNLSVRTAVFPDGPAIVGFVLGGSRPRNVLVRAIGPSLASFGVDGTLADPRLALMQGATLLAANDDWSGAADLRTAFDAVGAFSLPTATSKDAALLTTLNPGAYTVQVAGPEAASGLVLIEVYEAP